MSVNMKLQRALGSKPLEEQPAVPVEHVLNCMCHSAPNLHKYCSWGLFMNYEIMSNFEAFYANTGP